MFRPAKAPVGAGSSRVRLHRQQQAQRGRLRKVEIGRVFLALVAGLGAISATVLLAGIFSDLAARAVLVGIILAGVLITFLVFVLAECVDGFPGETGRSILTPLLGLILAALAVQFVADGVKALIAA